MARAVKSLTHGSVADNAGFGFKVVKHREHRSKGGRKKPVHQYGRVLLYKKKLQELKERDLKDDISTV